MHSFSTTLLYFILAIAKCNARIVHRCELLQAFYNQHEDVTKYGNWLCIAEQVSSYNTSLRIKTDTDRFVLGIFRILNVYWCRDEHHQGNGCGIDCSALEDDNIDDDVACAITIYKAHKFEGWGDRWGKSCKDRDLRNYTDGCHPISNEQEQPPKILKSELTHIFYRGTENQYVTCQAIGKPKPRLEWQYDKKKYPDAFVLTTATSIKLHFPQPPSNDINVTCLATNFITQDSASFYIKVEDRPGFPFAVVIPTFLILLIAAVAISLFVYRKYLVKHGLTQAEIEAFMKGAPERLKVSAFAHENSNYQPYDTSYEIQDGKLNIYNDQVIGMGQFGMVLRGDIEKIPVAVKTVQDFAELLYLKALLSELKVMIHIGRHPGVVSLLGARTKELDKGRVYIAVEFCALGDLEKYLRTRKGSFVDLNKSKSETDRIDLYENVDCITTLDILNWALQVASAMDHLEKRKVIHGDLACRNILLSDRSTAKVTDFGLSRQLYSYTNYVKKQQAPLPWRWMAFESLTQLTFSSQSDVWGFGVTLWEMFSLGDVPYPGLSWTLEFPIQIENGMRLLKPIHASDNQFKLMNDCWDILPKGRPSFKDLCNGLEKERDELTSRNISKTKF